MTIEENSDSQHSLKTKYFIGLLPDTDDVTTIVLKGHLIIEEILNDILESHCDNYDSMVKAHLSFYQKACVVKALVSTVGRVYFESIFLLNRLRNDLAHKLDSKKREALIESFIDESKTLFGESYNETSTLSGKLRNSICAAISSLSLSGDLSLIWKE